MAKRKRQTIQWPKEKGQIFSSLIYISN
jgi:hypothetical protein